MTFSANEPNSVLHRQEWENERSVRAKKTEGCPILNALFAFRVGTTNLCTTVEEWRFSATSKKQEMIPAPAGHQEPAPRQKQHPVP